MPGEPPPTRPLTWPAPPPAWTSTPPWPPQPTWPPQPAVRERPVAESGLPLAWALGATGIALLLSFLLDRYAGLLADPAQQLDRRLRQALVLTLLFYLVVGMALLVLCQVKRVGLVWSRGGAVPALVLGLPTGLVGGLLAVLLQSALRGRLASDPRAELLVGGGGALRVFLALTVLAVLAPLVEETLFRGILAGTLLARGVGPAVVGSAVAFSVWHMSPAALRYYVFMGLLLAGLWRKRGLVASMSAHAAFNGVLAVAAIAATTGGGHLVQYQGLSLQLPGGWHEMAPGGFDDELLATGPGGAALSVARAEGGQTDPEQVLAGLQRHGHRGRLTVLPGTARLVQLPAGQAVEADVLARGQEGHLLRLTAGSSSYVVLMVTGGSPAAERDWQRVTRSLEPTGGQG